MSENSVLAANRVAVLRAAKPKVYLESSFFTALFDPQSERFKIARDIIEDARNNRIELVISTLTLIECEARFEGDGAELLDAFFESEWLVRCNIDPFVASTARDLRQQLGGVATLTSNSWLHAATALWEGCGYLMSCDKRLLKLNGHKPLDLVQITTPARPWDAGQMSLTDLEGVMPESAQEYSRRSVTL